MDEQTLESLLTEWQEDGQGVTLTLVTGDEVTGPIQAVEQGVVIVQTGITFHFIGLDAVIAAQPMATGYGG